MESLSRVGLNEFQKAFDGNLLNHLRRAHAVLIAATIASAGLVSYLALGRVLAAMAAR